MEATRLKLFRRNTIETDSFFCYKRKHKDIIENNKIILKTEQRFKSERQNVFTKKSIRLI